VCATTSHYNSRTRKNKKSNDTIGEKTLEKQRNTMIIIHRDNQPEKRTKDIKKKGKRLNNIGTS
jgi:hypothetical protein